MGFPGFHPEASSPSIGRIIRSFRVCWLNSWNARNLPLGCHDAGYWLFLLSVRRCTSPGSVGALPVQIERRLRVPRRRKDDASAVRRPHRLAVVALVERQARERVPRPLVDPDVRLLAVEDVHREALAVGREEGIAPVCRRGRSGVVFPARSIQEIGASSVSACVGRYTSVPLADTANWAPVAAFDCDALSAGTGWPASSSRSRSNGTAKSVPCACRADDRSVDTGRKDSRPAAGFPRPVGSG